jgi:cobyrinic acid a,c-diamide synthase
MASEWISLDRVHEIARSAPALPQAPPRTSDPRPCCRIGIAWDDAFHFYYEDNLRCLEELGATIVRFSPLCDAELPDVDGVYLGGGYPEVHADGLTENHSMRSQIRAFAQRGGPVYAECGGLMYLARCIRTLDGRMHPMVGVIDADVVMAPKLVALGYVEVETQLPTPLGPPGLRFRGHQFRYSDIAPSSTAPTGAYSVRRRRGGDTHPEGYRVANVLASYVHAHWASNPLAARGLVDTCARFAIDRGRS